MSQSNLLSDEEIINYLDETFALKVDREALLKPNKEVIIDIYTRFLDALRFPWRNSKSSHEGHELFRMVGALRFIFAHYTTKFHFNMTDLVSPIRKRTLAFLHVLIYARALLQDGQERCDRLKAEQLAKQEENMKIREAISQARIERDQLAMRKSQEPVESRKRIDDRQRHFEEKRSRCEYLSGEVKSKIKQELASTLQEEQMLEKNCKPLQVELKRMHSVLDLIRKAPVLKDKITQLEKENEKAIDRLQEAKRSEQQLEAKISEQNRILNFDTSARIFESTKQLLVKTRGEYDMVNRQIESDRATIFTIEQEAEAKRSGQIGFQSSIDKLNARMQIESNKLEAEFIKEKRKTKSLETERKQTYAMLSSRLEKVKLEQQEELARRVQFDNHTAELIDKLERQQRDRLRRFQSAENAVHNALQTVSQNRRRIREIVGHKNSIVAKVPTPMANRTYIKETNGVA